MNLFAYPMIVVWTLAAIVFFLPSFACLKALTRWSSARVMRFLVWVYGRGWMAIMSPFVRFRREDLDGRGLSPPYVIVINHLSFFDFYCMALLPFFDMAVAVRAWPFKMFWYAPFMRLAGYLNVESLEWEGTLLKGAEILHEGGSVLFFPEGHRSRDGKLQRFFSGPFKLAKETGVKVLPLCMGGTDVLLPPDHWWMLPTRIRLAFLPPIDPAEFADHGELRRYTKALMEEKMEAIKSS